MWEIRGSPVAQGHLSLEGAITFWQSVAPRAKKNVSYVTFLRNMNPAFKHLAPRLLYLVADFGPPLFYDKFHTLSFENVKLINTYMTLWQSRQTAQKSAPKLTTQWEMYSSLLYWYLDMDQAIFLSCLLYIFIVF